MYTFRNHVFVTTNPYVSQSSYYLVTDLKDTDLRSVRTPFGHQDPMHTHLSPPSASVQ